MLDTVGAKSFHVGRLMASTIFATFLFSLLMASLRLGGSTQQCARNVSLKSCLQIVAGTSRKHIRATRARVAGALSALLPCALRSCKGSVHLQGLCAPASNLCFDAALLAAFPECTAYCSRHGHSPRHACTVANACVSWRGSASLFALFRVGCCTALFPNAILCRRVLLRFAVFFC